MNLLHLSHTAAKSATDCLRELRRRALMYQYQRSGRRAWTAGYYLYRHRYISGVLYGENLMEAFVASKTLPEGFGFALDERVVEYPWILSRLSVGQGRLLDAGSSLNHEMVLDHPKLKNKDITILTLAPERQCFWNRGISYVYHDLRDIPFREDFFDEIVCLSTLEHIGMDNTKLYIKSPLYREQSVTDYLDAGLGLLRTLKKGGRLLVTVPYGRIEAFQWFQQFDAVLLKDFIETMKVRTSAATFYRYTERGWNISDQSACSDMRYFDIQRAEYSSMEDHPDLAAAARAVACIEMVK